MPPITYALTILNGSATPGSFCLYQTAPPGLEALAWLVIPSLAPGETTELTWNLNYGFMFCSDAPTQFFAQTMNADPELTLQNSVTLATTTGGLIFQAPVPGPTPGTLTIAQQNDVLIGFAQSGTPLFAAPAAPAPPPLPFAPLAPNAVAYNIAFSPETFVPASVLPSPVPNSFPFTFPQGVMAQIATYSGGTTPWVVAPAV